MNRETAKKAAEQLFKIESLKRSFEQIETLKELPLKGAVLTFKIDNSVHEMYVNGEAIDNQSFIGNILKQLQQELATAQKELDDLKDDDSEADYQTSLKNETEVATN